MSTIQKKHTHLELFTVSDSTFYQTAVAALIIVVVVEVSIFVTDEI